VKILWRFVTLAYNPSNSWLPEGFLAAEDCSLVVKILPHS
jgi:hypothetical protein